MNEQNLQAVLLLVQDRVDYLASARNYTHSCAYKYGAFHSAMYQVLDGVLTPEQLVIIEQKAKQLFQ